MNDLNTTVRNLAAIAAAEKLLAEAKSREKTQLKAHLKRGNAYAYTATGEELGRADVKRPPKRKPIITITDESQVFAWMVEEFGPECIEQRVQLTEQGRKSFEAYVLEAHAMHDEEPYFDLPGVSVTVPAPGDQVVSFTPAQNVVELVRGMAQRGELNLSEVLALEGGES